MHLGRCLASVLAVGLLGIVTIGPPHATRAQDANPAACPTTTADENVALLTQLHDAMDTGADIAPFFAAENVVRTAAGQEMPNASLAWVSERLADYPDLTVTIEQVVAQDDRVAVYATWSGTHQGADETRGVPATGQRAEWASAVFFRIECGQIVEVWPVTDNLRLLMDLGVITEEEVQSVEAMATPTP